MDRICVKCVVLSITIYLSSVAGQKEPQITKEILPEIKKIGETGRLHCTVTRKDDNTVYWIYRGAQRQRQITHDDKVDVEDKFNEIIDGYPKYDVEMTKVKDQITYTLIVRRLQLDDAGTYTCQINIKGNSGKKPSKDGQMTVMIPPTITQSLTTPFVDVQEGSDATLMCHATGYPFPNITWIRPNGEALPQPYNTARYRGDRLMLTGVKSIDRGVYRCIADNTVRPPASYDARLRVNFKPVAIPVQTSYGQALGMNYQVLLECRISGYPDPDLRWYRVDEDGIKPINDDDKHTLYVLVSYGQMLSVSEYWYQLKIRNVQANDYGKYRCEGSNSLGNNNATVILYETSECQGANCPPGEPKSAASISTLSIRHLLVAMTTSILLLKHH